MSDAQLDRTDDYSVYQTSTIAALLAGVYDGDVTIAELLSHGDFGLGTFNALDGEMVVLDGVCYHLRSDGSVSIAAGTDRTPFAAVTHFRPQQTLPVAESTSRARLTARVDEALGSPNVAASVRIRGTFQSVRTRTVGAQKRPYPSLVTASASQAENVLEAVTCTIAGFRTPRFEEEISVAGYHLHFLDDAHSRGGHVLDFELTSGTVELAPIQALHLSLPTTSEFLTADMGTDVAAAEQQAEGGDS